MALCTLSAVSLRREPSVGGHAGSRCPTCRRGIVPFDRCAIYLPDRTGLAERLDHKSNTGWCNLRLCYAIF
jgi:hypothetical protein